MSLLVGSTHPIQKLVPSPRERQKPRLPVVKTERRAGELVAEELRLAQQALGSITGEFTSEDLLGRIFAGFCIGK